MIDRLVLPIFMFLVCLALFSPVAAAQGSPGFSLFQPEQPLSFSLVPVSAPNYTAGIFPGQPTGLFSYAFFPSMQSGTEPWLRRAEILFFISIPFTYIFLNALIILQNYMDYLVNGTYNSSPTDPQKYFLYSGLIAIGFTIIFYDFKD